MAVREIVGIRLWMRNLYDILKATFQVIVYNPIRLPLLGVGAWAWVEIAKWILNLPLVSVGGPRSQPVGLSALCGWGGVLLSDALTAPLATGVLIAAVSEYILQETIGMGRALWTAWRRASKLIGASLLVLTGVLGIALVTGFLFGAVRLTAPVQGAWRTFWTWAVALSGIIVVFYWLVRCTFAAQAVVLDGCSAQASLDQSRALIAGNWSRVLGALIALSIVSWFTTALLLTVPVLGSVLGPALTIPIHVVGTTLLYVELRAEREDKTREGVVKAQA